MVFELIKVTANALDHDNHSSASTIKVNNDNLAECKFNINNSNGAIGNIEGKKSIRLEKSKKVLAEFENDNTEVV